MVHPSLGGATSSGARRNPGRAGGSLLDSSALGRLVRADFYAGDGCHRIAFLWERGERNIPARHLRVQRFKTYRPLDNTALVARTLPVDRHWLG